MGYIYLPYIIVFAIVTFVICQKYGQKKWWAAVVLLVPPAAPAVFLKLKKNTGLILSVLSILTFCLAAGAEIYLFLDHKKKAAEDTVPPIIKKMIALNEDVKQTTIAIYNASGKLDSLSMVQSRITDIKSTIKTIKTIRELVEENQAAIQRLIDFAESHEVFFQRKNLDWIFAIRDFYRDHNVIQHHKSRDNYLATFENLLTYTYKNFDNIMTHKSQQHMKSYDVYYMRYRRAADSHNRFNKKRIAFQNQFMEQYPEVKPFLPGSHHLGSFKFWDKFSF